MNTFYNTLYIIILIGLCAIGEVKSQEKKSLINKNLNNYRISNSYEDTINFNRNSIYAIYDYKPFKSGDAIKNTKNFNGKPFSLISYTSYLRDGRKRYKRYNYGKNEHTTNYHYDADFNNLILIESRENNKSFTYNWLFYDQSGILNEDFEYKIYDKNALKYSYYIKYDISYLKDETSIKVTNYGSDTVASPVQSYIFTPLYLTKALPEYQSKWQKFKLFNGTYKPIETKAYIFDDRNVLFSYNDKGAIVSEVWYKPANQLENKTEYFYTKNGKEMVEQQYHMLGTQKSTKITRKYDQLNNLIFEQSIEYTGNPLGIKHYEYTYDQKGNWIEKKTYYQPCENGVYGKKELKEYEIRDIEYYTANQQPKSLILPVFPKQAKAIKNKIPELGAKKQKDIDGFNNAVSSGDFDERIKVQKADNLKDFTPEYWEVKATVFGDLDQNEGDEAAIVYKTPIKDDFGFAHSLAIFKKLQGKWQLWHQTMSPLLSDQAGGMMGNPFESIKIERRCIVIQHFGGSRDKWSYTHRYRFQNENWYLIGAYTNYGAPCDFWDTLDYNLSTGDAIVKHTNETCKGKGSNAKIQSWTEQIKLKKALPLMDEFTPGETRVKINKRDFEIYY